MDAVLRRRIRIGMVILPVVAGIWILWTARTAVFPFVVGMAIAYLMAPLVSYIARVLPFHRARPYLARGVAILILYASVAGAGVGLGFLLVPDAANEIQDFSDSLPDTIDSARERLQDLYDEYVPEEQHETVDGWFEDAGDAFSDWATGQLAPRTLEFVGSTFSIIIGYLTIPVWLYYTLKDHPRGVRSFIGMFPPGWRHDVRNVLGIADAVFKNYIRAMLTQGILVGVMAYIALEILDVNYPIGLAVIAGFTEMIPIIGPIIGAIPAMLVALADDPLKALWVALAFFIIQQIENNLIVPKVQGDFLRLHPGVIIVLLVVAGALGGLLWVILVVPAAALIRDLYQYAYLRLGETPHDEALDRALGEYGARALRQRLDLETVVPAAELGNQGFGPQYPPTPASEERERAAAIRVIERTPPDSSASDGRDEDTGDAERAQEGP
ncbi:MAG: AI-2E family transporter [Dehalococcoidia bacterium]